MQQEEDASQAGLLQPFSAAALLLPHDPLCEGNPHSDAENCHSCSSASPISDTHVPWGHALSIPPWPSLVAILKSLLLWDASSMQLSKGLPPCLQIYHQIYSGISDSWFDSDSDSDSYSLARNQTTIRIPALLMQPDS